MTTDHLARYRHLNSAALLEEVRTLAAEFAGGSGRAAELAAAAAILQYRYSFPLHQGARGPLPDSGLPDIDLMRTVVFQSNGFYATTAGEVRAAMNGRPVVDVNLVSAPDPLPADDQAPVLLYNPLAGVAALVGRITRGEDETGALEDVRDRAVLNRPPYVEF